MIKTLGPLEDASDIASIAPVLQNWADEISHQDMPVSAPLITHAHETNFCCLLVFGLSSCMYSMTMMLLISFVLVQVHILLQCFSMHAESFFGIDYSHYIDCLVCG